ncbi:MAG: class II glutamine amidotransferase [Bdellovibrionaceae bacterium]|nr:class II glutamine amidotransferase [Pseudobdellovibrionaceae bacterium]
MCRIFGFRSILESHMHESLISADNALSVQSQQHPDGWGIAYYVHNTPHVIKSTKSAQSDVLFPKVSSVVSSNTVIAHIRNATLGEKNILNTHPFQFGPWVFVHNGHVKDFEKHRPALLELIPESTRKYILGTTDSEILFYIIMGHAAKTLNIFNQDIPFKELKFRVTEALHMITEVIGRFSKDDVGPTENYITFILSNGKITLAHHGGKHLYYSTYKKLCGERDSCPFFNLSCENKTPDGKVNHFLVSSEQLKTNNVWLDFEAGELMGVDQEMNFYKEKIFDF